MELHTPRVLFNPHEVVILYKKTPDQKKVIKSKQATSENL